MESIYSTTEYGAYRKGWSSFFPGGRPTKAEEQFVARYGPLHLKPFKQGWKDASKGMEFYNPPKNRG